MIVAATESMERIVVSGAALKEELARVSLTKVPDRPGMVARVFHTMARHDVMVDDIIQTVNDDKTTASLSFTVDLAEFNDAKKVCDKLAKTLKCNVSYDDSLSKVSVVGVGMRVHTGVAEKMFSALADAKINIENITTSEIKISCMIDRSDGKKALRLVHDAFELGGKKKKKTKKVAKKKAKKTAKKKK